jgi:hypothetical protein
MRDGVHNWESISSWSANESISWRYSSWVRCGCVKLWKPENWGILGLKRMRNLRDSVYGVVIDKEEWCAEGFTKSLSKMNTCGVTPGPEEFRWWGVKRRGIRDELEFFVFSSMVCIDSIKGVGLVCVQWLRFLDLMDCRSCYRVGWWRMPDESDIGEEMREVASGKEVSTGTTWV